MRSRLRGGGSIPGTHHLLRWRRRVELQLHRNGLRTVPGAGRGHRDRAAQAGGAVPGRELGEVDETRTSVSVAAVQGGPRSTAVLLAAFQASDAAGADEEQALRQAHAASGRARIVAEPDGAIAERQQWRRRSRRRSMPTTSTFWGEYLAPAAVMVTVPKAEDPKGWYPTVVLTEIVSEAGVVPEVAESAIHGWFFDAVQLTAPMLLRIRSVRWRTTQLRVEPGW